MNLQVVNVMKDFYDLFSVYSIAETKTSIEEF